MRHLDRGRHIILVQYLPCVARELKVWPLCSCWGVVFTWLCLLADWNFYEFVCLTQLCTYVLVLSKYLIEFTAD